MINIKLTAAVAGILALGAASSSFAGVTQAQALAGQSFWMGGSSAAVSGFGTAIGADLCGGAANVSEWVTNPSKMPTTRNAGAVGTPDFRVFSCVAAAGKPFAGNVVTIYYRAEAGSVVGVYAPYNNVAVNELNLATAYCVADPGNPQSDGSTQYDCATSNNAAEYPAAPAGGSVVGTSPIQGPGDGYTGSVALHTLEVGISDVEPGALGNSLGELWAGNGNNDPVSGAYYTFLGNDATPNQLQNMPHSVLFQQSFGFIASKGLGISDLPSAAISSILAGVVTDWSKVAQGSVLNGAANPNEGKPVAAAATPIVICHRDLGSGTRTSADIVFEQDGCDPTGATKELIDNGAVPDSFSTGDVLACVQGQAAAIGYVSIDNYSKAGAAPYANTVALSLDGRTPSNLLTAVGGWQYAVEASANENPTLNFNAGNLQTFYTNYLIPALKALATAPQSAQVNALPGIGGNASNSGTVQTNGKIHVSSFVRNSSKGNSCNPLYQQ
jgi:hypothetical protein